MKKLLLLLSIFVTNELYSQYYNYNNGNLVFHAEDTLKVYVKKTLFLQVSRCNNCVVSTLEGIMDSNGDLKYWYKPSFKREKVLKPVPKHWIIWGWKEKF